VTFSLALEASDDIIVCRDDSPAIDVMASSLRRWPVCNHAHIPSVVYQWDVWFCAAPLSVGSVSRPEFLDDSLLCLLLTASVFFHLALVTFVVSLSLAIEITRSVRPSCNRG